MRSAPNDRKPSYADTRRAQAFPSPSALLGAALAAIALLDWELSHAYRGVFHDAGLYLLQGLAHRDPRSLGQDVFLRLGSQDRFSAFGPLLGLWLRAPLAPEALAAAATLVFQLALIAATALLGRTVLAPRAAILGLITVIAVPGVYGADRVFTVMEPFLTSRMAAEALGLAGLAAVVAERRGLAVPLFVLGGLLHPVMAAAGLVASFFYCIATSHRRLVIWTAAGTAFVALGLALPAVSGERLDGTWLTEVERRAPYLFLSGWASADWSRLMLVGATLVLGARGLEGSKSRRLCAAVLATLIAGIAVTALGVDLAHSAWAARAQPWRCEWLAQWAAALVLPSILMAGARPAWGPARRLLAAAWLLDPGPGALGIAALAPIADLAHPRLGAEAQRLIEIGCWLLLILALAVQMGSDLQFTEAYYLDVRLPISLRRATSFVHSGAVPVALAMGLAWLARPPATDTITARSAVALGQPLHRLTLGLAAFCGALAAAALVPVTANQWLRRDYSMHESAFAAWRRLIPPTAEVFWPESPPAAWLLLERPHYISTLQTSGMVFSRAAAAELTRRAESLAAVIPPAQFLEWGSASLALALSPRQLEASCELHAFDYLVTSVRLPRAPSASLPPPYPLGLYRCR